MGRRIEITALDSDAKAIAELYDDTAPLTCALMWQCLESPMETEGIQAMCVGRELMFVMPKENQRGDPTRLPCENGTAYPIPGDVIFHYFPARMLRQYYHGGHDTIRERPLWDFYIIYGPDPILGALRTVWAHIVEGLDDLARDAARIRHEGTRRYRVRRLEQSS
jgi:hypothetical protein